MPPRKKNTPTPAFEADSSEGMEKLQMFSDSEDEEPNFEVDADTSYSFNDEGYEEFKQKRTRQVKVPAKKKTGSSVGKTKEKAKATVKTLEKKAVEEEDVKMVKAATPTTFNIVLAALNSSEDKKGMSLMAIKKYYTIHYPEKEWRKANSFVKRALLRGLSEGIIIRAKSSSESVGVKGMFKIHKEHIKATDKKAKGIAFASGSGKPKKKLVTVLKTKVKVMDGIEKPGRTPRPKKSTKKAKKVEEEKEQEMSEKENEVPGKRARPPNKKLGPSVKTARRISMSTPSKLLKSKIEMKNLSNRKPLNKSKSAPLKTLKGRKQGKDTSDIP